jgi:arylsulfatase A-like enzyme
LVTEPVLGCDLYDRFALPAEFRGGGIQARFEKKIPRPHPDFGEELPVELASREPGGRGQRFHAPEALRIAADEADRLGGTVVGRVPDRCFAAPSGNSRDAQRLGSVHHRVFVGGEPCEGTTALEEHFGPAQQGLARNHHLAISFDEHAGDLGRVTIVIRSAGDFGYLAQPQALEQGAVDVDKAALGILEEEKSVRNVLEKRTERRGQRAAEQIRELGSSHVRWIPKKVFPVQDPAVGSCYVGIMIRNPLRAKLGLLAIVLLAPGIAPLVGYGAEQRQSPKKPNILYIMSDDHTTQAIGAYGGRLCKLGVTPTLDRLAAEGMRFERVFCNNSICTPSRASILTGQYSQRNGVLDLNGALPPERQYLPIEMKKAGYLTALIGKWHLEAEPLAFDYYRVLPGQGKYFDPELLVRGPKKWPQNIEKHTGYVSDVITDLTIEWLEQRDRTKPFLLMHHHKAPHDMFEYAPRYEGYLRDIEIPEPENLYDQPQPGFGSLATRGESDSLVHRIGTSVSKRHPVRNYGIDFKIAADLDDHAYTKAAYQEYLKRYLRCVRGVDDNLARLFDYLKKSGDWENTVVIYTSDQGMMLGEHDYIDKRWMYDESMRMPLIMRWPGKIQAGSVNTLLINNTDFAPTLLEIAGVKEPSVPMQGRSFAAALEGGTLPDWRTATYYRYWMHLMHHDIPAHFGIRTADYKLIFFYGQPTDEASRGKPSMAWKKEESFKIEPTPAAWEFYDLRTDPSENRNQYANPKYAETIRALKAQLHQTRAELEETDFSRPHIQRVIDEHWSR